VLLRPGERAPSCYATACATPLPYYATAGKFLISLQIEGESDGDGGAPRPLPKNGGVEDLHGDPKSGHAPR